MLLVVSFAARLEKSPEKRYLILSSKYCEGSAPNSQTVTINWSSKRHLLSPLLSLN